MGPQRGSLHGLKAVYGIFWLHQKDWIGCAELKRWGCNKQAFTGLGPCGLFDYIRKTGLAAPIQRNGGYDMKAFTGLGPCGLFGLHQKDWIGCADPIWWGLQQASLHGFGPVWAYLVTSESLDWLRRSKEVGATTSKPSRAWARVRDFFVTVERLDWLRRSYMVGATTRKPSRA